MSTDQAAIGNKHFPFRVKAGLAAMSFLVFAVLIALVPWTASAQQEGNRGPTDESFVGAEPRVCDVLGTEGPLRGLMHYRGLSDSAQFRAILNQSGCLLGGEFVIRADSSLGSGPLHGTIDGNFVRFTVPGETSGVAGDRNFSGVRNGQFISGKYFVTDTDEVGEWILITDPNADADRLLSDATARLDRQAAAVARAQPRSRDQTDSDRSPQSQQTNPAAAAREAAAARQQQDGNQIRSDSNAAPQATQTTRTDSAATTSAAAGDSAASAAAAATAAAAAASDSEESTPAETESGDTAAEEPASEEKENRGFFSNSVSESNSIDKALEPTTLAVIGILLTLVATGVQLLRGN